MGNAGEQTCCARVATWRRNLIGRRALQAVVALMALTFSSLAAAQTFHVCPNGSASGDGLAPSTAWSLACALGAEPGCNVPAGSTVLLHDHDCDASPDHGAGNPPRAYDVSTPVALNGTCECGVVEAHPVGACDRDFKGQVGMCVLIEGTAAQPIVVRSQVGEWAVIEDNRTQGFHDCRARLTIDDPTEPLFGRPCGAINPVQPDGADPTIPQKKGMATLAVNGSYVHLQDIEVRNRIGVRFSVATGDVDDDPTITVGLPAGIAVLPAVGAAGPVVGAKLINVVVHDAGLGVVPGRGAHDFELYGSLMYNNGTRPVDNEDRPHGHGVYWQHGRSTGVERQYVVDSIAVNNYLYGFHGFSGDVEDQMLARSIWAGNGSPSTDPSPRGSIFQPKDGDLLRGIHVNESVGWSVTLQVDPGAPLVTNHSVLELGDQQGTSTQSELDLAFNHLVGFTTFTQSSTQRRVEGNTFFGGDSGGKTPAVVDGMGTEMEVQDLFRAFVTANPNNEYYLRNLGVFQNDSGILQGPPPGNRVRIYRNREDPKRANIAVMRFDRTQSVKLTADATCMGTCAAAPDPPLGAPVPQVNQETTCCALGDVLQDGDPYVIRDAQDYFGRPVACGFWQAGATLHLPMENLKPVQPHEIAQFFLGPPIMPDEYTSPHFGAFVVEGGHDAINRYLRGTRESLALADFVVDENGNGKLDPGETTLIDTDGDGTPDLCDRCIGGDDGDPFVASPYYHPLGCDPDTDDPCELVAPRCEEGTLHAGEIVDCLPLIGDPVTRASVCNHVDTDHDAIADDDDCCSQVADVTNADSNLTAERYNFVVDAGAGDVINVPPEQVTKAQMLGHTWGDACDPVPVPAARATTYKLLQEPEIIRHDLIEVAPLASHRSRLNGVSTTVADMVEVQNVETHFRACMRPDPTAIPPDPVCVSLSSMKDARLLDALNLDDEDRPHPYHRVTMSLPGQVPLPGEPLIRPGQTAFFNYDQPDVRTSPQQFQWLFHLDIERWLADSTSFVPPTEPTSLSGFMGTFWVFADTCAGRTSERDFTTNFPHRCTKKELDGGPPDPPISNDPELRNVGTGLPHGNNLASAHFDIVPIEDAPPSPGVPPSTFQFFSDLSAINVLPRPDGCHPPGRFVPPTGINFFSRPFLDSPPGEVRMLVSPDLEFGTPSYVGYDGLLHDATAQMDDAILAALTGSDSLLVAAAEPAYYPASQNPTIAVVLSEDGTTVRAKMAVQLDGSLVETSAASGPTLPCTAGTVLINCGGVQSCVVPCDGTIGDGSGAACTLEALPSFDDESSVLCQPLIGVPPCPAGTISCVSTCAVPCDGTIDEACTELNDEGPLLCGELPGAASAAAATAGPCLPAPRRDFQAIYSRHLDRLFILGGRDAATNDRLDDVMVMTSQGTFPFSTASLGRVRAVTYSYRTGSLWVLDEVRKPKRRHRHHRRWRHHRWHHGGQKRLRLLEIDARTGTHTVVAEWKRRRLFDRHWLVSDLDGSLLVIASSKWRRRHVVARFEAETNRLTHVVRRPGRLLLAPSVDAFGYAFVKAKRRFPWHKPRIEYERLATLGDELDAATLDAAMAVLDKGM